MSRYGYRRRTNWGFIVVVAVLAAAAVLISLADTYDFGGKIPTWNEIFAKAGMAEPVRAEVTESDDKAAVHFIDVGQGDSIFIKTPSKNILIDAGTPDSASAVVAYLKAQNVKKLDYIVATHPHADHIGGMPYVLREFEVDVFIAPRIPDEIIPTGQSYENMLSVIAKKGMRITPANVGDVYELGDNAELTVLGPVNADSDNMNNNSVVTRFTYGDISFLLAGDGERGEEGDILAGGADIRADVLKLGHHGSSTSSGADWLDAVAPSYAVVSCGEDNSYGHPHTEVVEQLDKLWTEVHRTDIEGTIVFETDGTKLRLAGGGNSAAESAEPVTSVGDSIKDVVEQLADEIKKAG